ncbi:hypothetical protein Tco_1158271 [Tanacetum coccineum]
MVDWLNIVETDKVIHTMEIDIVKLVVEIESFGMISDEFDKEIGSSDGLQPKQADLSCVHALNEFHLHEIHVEEGLVVVDGWTGQNADIKDGVSVNIMGEPLPSDRVFEFPMDEPEPHPAYDFFAPRPLLGYADNPNNMNGWIEAYVLLLGKMGEPLGAEVDETMVDPVIDELAEPIVEAEEQVIALVIDVEEDIAMLFGDDDFSDDDSEGFKDDEEVWEINEEWLMAPVTPPLMPVVPPPSTYKDLCTRVSNLEYGHGQLVKKVIQVSDVKVADGITIREISLRVSDVEGQVQVMESHIVQAMGRLEQVDTQMEQGQQTATQREEVISRLSQHVQTLQAAVQQRDVQIQQLQTMVLEMSNRESTLMQCILRMDRRLANLEKRPPGPQ